MIVIERIAPIMPTRPRYPGSIDLPILIPPSPPGSEVILPSKKSSSIWFFGVLAGIVGAIAISGQSDGSRLGAIHRKRRGDRLYYMYVPPGKWFEDAVSIPKKKLKDYKHKATYTPGQLYYIWAESADIARYFLRTDAGKREHSAYEAILDISPRRKPEPPKAKRLSKAEQLTLFSGNPLAGATANCLLWQEVESRKTGGLVWRCAQYGPSCDGASCLPEKYKFQTRTCVRTKKVPALSPRWNKKTVTRCAEYQRVCATASCLDKPFPKPAASPGHNLNVKSMIRGMARQMAQDKNMDEEIAGKALGREIMDRGGIRQYRKGREKEEFKIIPLFMRRKEGLPPDEMASEMGYRDDSELFEAIRKEYPGIKKKKRRYTADDFMLHAEGYVWTAIEQGQVHGLGQDLFPELRRELALEPAEDIATSDDPVTACMERLGWKIPRMNQLKANIAWKLTPDMFTGKTERLSPGEKEYQRVISECLEARSGTAGALGARRYSIAAQAVQASQRDTRAMSMYLTNQGITVNKDQTVTLYHGTTEKSAKEIMRDGRIKGTAGKNVREHIQNAAWLTPDKEFVKIWGDKVLTMRVPVQYLRHLAQNFKEFYFEGGLKKDAHRKGEWIPENYPRENWVIKVARADFDFYIKEPRRLLGERGMSPPEPWMTRQPFTEDEIQAYKDYVGDQSFNPHTEFFRELENTEFNISFAMRARQIGVMPRPVAEAMREYRRWLYLLYKMGPRNPGRIQELRDGVNKARRDVEKKTDVMKKARGQTGEALEETKFRIMNLIYSESVGGRDGLVHVDVMEKRLRIPYNHIVGAIKDLLIEGKITEYSAHTYMATPLSKEPQQLTFLGAQRYRLPFAATL